MLSNAQEARHFLAEMNRMREGLPVVVIGAKGDGEVKYHEKKDLRMRRRAREVGRGYRD